MNPPTLDRILARAVHIVSILFLIFVALVWLTGCNGPPASSPTFLTIAVIAAGAAATLVASVSRSHWKERFEAKERSVDHIRNDSMQAQADLRASRDHWKATANALGQRIEVYNRLIAVDRDLRNLRMAEDALTAYLDTWAMKRGAIHDALAAVSAQAEATQSEHIELTASL